MTHVRRIGLALLLAGGMAYYYYGLFVPAWRAHLAARGLAGGCYSDLYPRWLATRELLINHRDPYAPEVTRNIQKGFYGRSLQAADAHVDQERFAYPAYTVFLFAPTIAWPFPYVGAVFTSVFFVLTAASVPLWCRGLGVDSGAPAKTALTILMLGSFPVLDALYLQQLTLLVAALLAAAAASVAHQRLAVAGVLLAFAMIKPQVAALPALFLFLWVLGNWPARKKLVWGFAATMVLLWTGAELLLPGWVGRWLDQLGPYVGYTRPPRLQWLLGDWGGSIVALFLLGLLAVFSWRNRRQPAGSSAFGLGLVLALAITVSILPNGTGSNYDQVLLLPAALWLGGSWGYFKQKPLLILYVLAGVLLFWEWASALGVVLVSFAPSAPAVEKSGMVLPHFGLLLFPFVVLLLASLVMVRRMREGTALVPTQGWTIAEQISPRASD